MTQRIVSNKHYSDVSQITRDKFLDFGEIVISNEPGLEGIYVLNSLGNVVKIGGGGGGSASGGSSMDDVIVYLRNNYLTSGQTIDAIRASEQNLSGLISLVSTSLAEHKRLNDVDFADVNARIDALGEICTEEKIRELAALEVAKVVASADTAFDTLKEIADWITNDTTGAAKMANDIVTLSGAAADLKDYIDSKTSGATASSDHVFLSRVDYNNLLTYGMAEISGVTYYYNPNVYYCIYSSGGDDQPDSGTTEPIGYIESGTGFFVLNNATIDDDGLITFLPEVIGVEDGFIDVDSVIPTPTPEEDEIEYDPASQMGIFSHATVGADGFIELTGNNIEIIQ